MDTSLFRTHQGRQADTVNAAGGTAYGLNAREALASYAATGCLRNTFYAGAQEQLDQALALAGAVDLEFVAKVAVYSRKRGNMKDMPAVLGTFVMARDPALWGKIADRVYDNGRMIRNLVQAVRSGKLTTAAGTPIRNIPQAVRRHMRKWLTTRPVRQLLNESVGNTPSIADLIKMVHPKPIDDGQRALFGMLIGREFNREALPQLARDYLDFRDGRLATVPPLDFRLFSDLGLSKSQWADISATCGWQALRMNLATFGRHGVLDDPSVVRAIAARLSDRDEITRARVMPYQLLVAFKNTQGLPAPIGLALQDAMEIATENVPVLPGKSPAVAVDVSGSMASPVTGGMFTRGRGAATSVRCVDVAALVASCALRRNPEISVIPFDTGVHRCQLNPRDSVMTNAQKLAAFGGGGTNIGLAFQQALVNRNTGLWLVSDNESWMDSRHGVTVSEQARRSGHLSWTVLHDIQPSSHTQVDTTRPGVLHVGGFTDAVFDVVAGFAQGSAPDHWSTTIDREVVL